MDARHPYAVFDLMRPLLLLGFLITSISLQAATGPIAVTGAVERPAATQSGAVIASNGSEAFIAWTEGDSPIRIFGRRYSANGFSEEPIPLTDAATGGPAVAATSDGWLVAWPALEGTRVQFVGGGSLPPPVTIATSRSCNGGVQLASIGSRALLLTGCGDISGSVLDARGNLLRDGIALGDTRGSTFWFGETGEGSAFLVLSAVEQWSGANEHDIIKTTRVAADGAIESSFTVAELAGAADHVVAAFDGTKTTAAWISELQLYTTTIDAKATTAAAARKASDSYFDDLAVASSGGSTWVALREYGTKNVLDRAKLVDGALSATTAISPRAWLPSMIVMSGRPVAAWTSLGQSSRRVLLQDGDAASTPVAPNAPDRFSAADAVSSGPSAVGVWEEDFGGLSRIACGGIDATGQRIAGSGVVISGESVGARTPSISFGNGSFLAAWFDVDKQAVVARRLNASLQPIDAVPFVIGASVGGKPALAFDGSNWLVAFVREEDPAFPASVAAVRISSAGVVLDTPPIPVSPFSWLPALSVDAAWDGRSFRVAWGEIKSIRAVTESQVRTARLFSDGSVTELVDLSPDRQTYAAGEPQVARGNSSTLLAWIENGGISALLEPRIIEGQPAALSGRRRAMWQQRIAAVPAGQVLTFGPVTFDGTLFHLFWRKSNEEISHETLIAPSGYVSQTSATWPAVLGATQYGSGLALLTIDRVNAPGLFWTIR